MTNYNMVILCLIKMVPKVICGVHYHLHRQAPSSSSKLVVQTCNKIVLYDSPPHRHLGWKNRMWKNRYPNGPKSNRSGYNLFFAKNIPCSNLFINIEREFQKSDWRITPSSSTIMKLHHPVLLCIMKIHHKLRTWVLYYRHGQRRYSYSRAKLAFD